MANTAVSRFSGRTTGARTVESREANSSRRASNSCNRSTMPTAWPPPQRRHDGCPCRQPRICAMPDSGKPLFVEHAQRILTVLAERGDAFISMALIQGKGIGLTNARLKARNDNSVRDQA